MHTYQEDLFTASHVAFTELPQEEGALAHTMFAVRRNGVYVITDWWTPFEENADEDLQALLDHAHAEEMYQFDLAADRHRVEMGVYTEDGEEFNMLWEPDLSHPANHY